MCDTYKKAFTTMVFFKFNTVHQVDPLDGSPTLREGGGGREATGKLNPNRKLSDLDKGIKL